MGYYKVKFGDYCLCHSDSCKYFDHFEFNGKKYYIGSYVKLTERGMREMVYYKGHNYVKGDFRLVDHYLTDKGSEEWQYFIGHLYNSTTPVVHVTRIAPNELVSEVLCNEIDENIHSPGELKVTFTDVNYSPKDWEVDGVVTGWVIMALILIIAPIFKCWWITLLIQIATCLYFGSWREKKMNAAISKQKFKE